MLVHDMKIHLSEENIKKIEDALNNHIKEVSVRIVDGKYEISKVTKQKI